jgi:hypothetical protein
MSEKTDFDQIAATLQLAWRTAPDGDTGTHAKWLLCVSPDAAPLVVVGKFRGHKLIPVPEGYHVVGAGDLDYSGQVSSWFSEGLDIDTPSALQQPIERLFEGNVSLVQGSWYR